MIYDHSIYQLLACYAVHNKMLYKGNTSLVSFLKKNQ